MGAWKSKWRPSQKWIGDGIGWQQDFHCEGRSGEPVAGKKLKCRIAYYIVRRETVHVPGEEGRVLDVFEAKGIRTVLQGSKLLDGTSTFSVGCGDLSTEAATGPLHGVQVSTDRDGDNDYIAWEAKMAKDVWSGTWTLVMGTGKFEAAKGKGTFTSFSVAPNQICVESEGEWEWPRSGLRQGPLPLSNSHRRP